MLVVNSVSGNYLDICDDQREYRTAGASSAFLDDKTLLLSGGSHSVFLLYTSKSLAADHCDLGEECIITDYFDNGFRSGCRNVSQHQQQSFSGLHYKPGRSLKPQHSFVSPIWLQCDTCKKWFHADCLKLKRIPKDFFYCSLVCKPKKRKP